MPTIGKFQPSFVSNAPKSEQVKQQGTPVITGTPTPTSTPFANSSFQDTSKPLVAGVGRDALSFQNTTVAGTNPTVAATAARSGGSGHANLPTIPITDPRWSQPPLSAAVTGQPPNQSLDLSRVTPEMLKQMSPDQLQSFFGMINASGQTATVFYQNSDLGMPYAEPSRDLASAMMMQLWNQSQDPAMLLKAMQAGFSPSSSTYGAYMSNLYSARTVEGLNTAMRADRNLSPSEANVLVNFMNTALSAGADPAGMANTVDGLIATMKQNPNAYASQAGSLVATMTAFPSLATANRIADMFTTLKATGGKLDGPEADKLGTLVQSFFSQRLGSNPSTEQAQQAMTELLNAFGAQAPSPSSPDFGQTMGYAAGIISAGLIKHFNSVNADIEQKREMAQTMLGVLGSGTALIDPVGGQVLAAAMQTLLSTAIDHMGELKDPSVIRQWQGNLLMDWQQGTMGREAAQDASVALVAALLANGVDL